MHRLLATVVGLAIACAGGSTAPQVTCPYANVHRVGDSYVVAAPPSVALIALDVLSAEAWQFEVTGRRTRYERRGGVARVYLPVGERAEITVDGDIYAVRALAWPVIDVPCQDVSPTFSAYDELMDTSPRSHEWKYRLSCLVRAAANLCVKEVVKGGVDRAQNNACSIYTMLLPLLGFAVDKPLLEYRWQVLAECPECQPDREVQWQDPRDND